MDILIKNFSKIIWSYLEDTFHDRAYQFHPSSSSNNSTSTSQKAYLKKLILGLGFFGSEIFYFLIYFICVCVGGGGWKRLSYCFGCPIERSWIEKIAHQIQSDLGMRKHWPATRKEECFPAPTWRFHCCNIYKFNKQWCKMKKNRSTQLLKLAGKMDHRKLRRIAKIAQRVYFLEFVIFMNLCFFGSDFT